MKYINYLIESFKNLPYSKKLTISIVLIFVIGISLIGLVALYNNSRVASEKSSFQSLRDTIEPSPEGDVAGETTEATASPTITQSYYRKYSSPTPTIPKRVPTQKTNTTQTRTTTSGSTTTSTTSNNTSNTTTSVTNTPIPTSVPPSNTSIPNAPTAAPTNTPVPAPTATPTPGPSISTSVNTDENKINVTASAYGEIWVCNFYFKGNNDVPIETKSGSISGDKSSCSTDTSDNPDILKIVALFGMKDGSQPQVEKSRPF